MKAVTCTGGELAIAEVPDPRPAKGQLVLAVTRCGICGSDLHAQHSADALADVMDELAYPDFMRATNTVVMGHEFVGEVTERGSGAAQRFKPGASVVAFPVVRRDGRAHPTGLSPLAPGGYAEQVLTEASLTFAVPNGLSPDLAALTEPMAVALHAVRRSEIGKRDVGIVLGCGPVGLAVICHLQARGVRTIVASDPSASRRELARRCGAHVVVDPTTESPYTAAPAKGWMTTAPDVLDLAVDAMTKLRRLPGWSHVYRAADALGATDLKRPVIFECVGVPGMIDGVIGAAPLASRIVVVGVCMGQDTLRPSMAINKEIDLRFVLAYTPLEFRDSLHLLAEGAVDATPLVTGTVGLEGVAGAFDELRDPSRPNAKILVDPTLTR